MTRLRDRALKQPETVTLGEAVQYRSLDRNYWESRGGVVYEDVPGSDGDDGEVYSTMIRGGEGIEEMRWRGLENTFRLSRGFPNTGRRADREVLSLSYEKGFSIQYKEDK